MNEIIGQIKKLELKKDDIIIIRSEWSKSSLERFSNEVKKSGLNNLLLLLGKNEDIKKIDKELAKKILNVIIKDE